MITVQRVQKAAAKHVSKGWLSLMKAAGKGRGFCCPACGSAVVGFFRYGDCASWGCPECGASPRERLMNHLLENGRLSVPQGGSILHLAPNEGSLVRRFSRAAADYVPADLDPTRYAVPGVTRVDLMALADRDRFDVIYASHVMEHVPDDMQVLANMHRALKPGGMAWLIVPLHDAPTEDGSFDMSPREREIRFGQWDHVRQYGMDFGERIAKAGFALEIVRASDMDASAQRTQALDDVLFIARKP